MRTFPNKLSALSVVLPGLHAAIITSQPLVSSPGDTAIIPGWSLQSATRITADISGLSQSGADVSTWYRMGSRGTVMAGLIESGVYDDASLFFSENMKQLTGQPTFYAPWLYREEFTLSPTDGHFFTLKTHGISSKADIYVNGALIASSEQQAGAYGGLSYNLTDHVQTGANYILIRAHPTNYLRDFAMGFLDWNPYPADNGTGVWRNVELSQTGTVSMSPFRVLTDFTQPGLEDKVNVTLRTELVNHAAKTVHVTVHGTIKAPDGSEAASIMHSLEMIPGENKRLWLRVPINDPQVWWPARWGPQPLYTVQANATVHDGGSALSDRSRSQTFGIRSVSSMVSEHNDTVFSVNGQRFQVMGAGYGPDMFMRFDEKRVENIFRYMLDMGLNTVRLEGKQEHPELYELADQLGMMILAGWECCDKWEAWEVRS